MFMQCKKKKCALLAIGMLVLLATAFGFPAAMLSHKAPLAEQHYVLGWNNGCESGVSAWAPLRALFSKQPFIKVETETSFDTYKSGWNEGYTSCRFSQDSWFSFFSLAFIILMLIATRCRCGENK